MIKYYHGEKTRYSLNIDADFLALQSPDLNKRLHRSVTIL